MSAQIDQSCLFSPIRVRRIIDRFDVICVAAVLLSFVLTSRLPFAVSKYSDSYFHDEAKEVSRVLRGMDSWNQVTISRAPAPVFYYAIPYLFVQPDSPVQSYWRAALAWNAFWMIVAVILIRRTGELLLDPLAGKISAILTLAVPFAIYYSFGISAETPAYVAAVLFIYGWARWRKDPDKRLLTLGSGMAMGGAVALVLCRPNALLVLAIAAACGVALWFYNCNSARKDIKFVTLTIATVLASVALMSFALKHLPKQQGVDTQTSNLSDVLFFGSFQFRSEPWDWRFWGKATRQGSVDYRNWVDTRKELLEKAALVDEPMSRVEMHWVLSDIVSHPVKRIEMFLVRVLALNIWIEGSTKPSAFRIGPLKGLTAYVVFHILLNLMALLTLVLSIWFLIFNRSEFFAYWPLWGTWIGLLLFHAFSYSEPRYMLPAEPGLAVMGACALSARIRSGRKTADA